MEEVVVEDQVFKLGDIKGCRHVFVRRGKNVECKKCGVGFIDETGEFPIEEANKHFDGLNG